MTNNRDENLDGIAIIGVTGRFPGAKDVDSFWKNLLNGKESITFFARDELSSQIAKEEKDNPAYVPARGILSDIDLFDADFFSIPPIEAQIMDPQQRCFLELCWEAMETSGYTSSGYPGLIGVYGGMNNNSYYLNNVLSRPDAVKKIGSFQSMLANEKDFLTTKVSYKLNLTGPSENIYTACSTSLVAIIKAFQALMTYQCDMALAGGVSITVPQNSGYLYQEGNILSPDGHCRPFDERSQGTTFNNGAGVVVLKRFEDALEDRDNIIAVIRGTGLNNDGAEKVSFTAPSVNGQKNAIQMAISQADFSAETISYVETHGTATPMGDPIEVSALTQAFAILPEQGKTCLIGSVKSNVGHTVHAAGVTGLIKTALALQNKLIPPTLFYTASNPQIQLEKTPFSVCAKLTEWPEGKTPRRAGVSSFGVGGTNAHVILEEYQSQNFRPETTRPYHILPVSAKTETAARSQLKNIGAHLIKQDVALEDVAYTLQNGRTHFNFRAFAVCEHSVDAAKKLSEQSYTDFDITNTIKRDPEIVLMFPGQGSQHLRMAEGIYQHNSCFKNIIDRGTELLLPLLDSNIRDLIFSDEPSDASRLKETRYAQPAIFLIEYALAKLWKELGVHPAAMIGHSIGELTAACLAGVFSFEDAIRVVAQRGKLMQDCPAGSMLSVRHSPAEIEKMLPQELVVATINAPNLCVIGGETDAVTTFQGQLEQQNIPCQILHTSHAFHTQSMEGAASGLSTFMEKITLSPPSTPFISCVSGSWITDEQATSPAYWGKQIRQPVQFSAGISQILNEIDGVFLEAGPRATLNTLTRQHLKEKKVPIISTLTNTVSTQADYHSFITACGNLWLSGMNLDWKKIYNDEERFRVPLPTYPFEKKSFWLDPLSQVNTEGQTDIATLKDTNLIPFKGETLTTSAPQSGDIQHHVIKKLRELILESSGIEISDQESENSFLELGFDSLILTQLATILSNEFSTAITFRQMMEDLDSVASLAEYLSIHSSGIEKMLPDEPQQESFQGMAAATQNPATVHYTASSVDTSDGTLQTLLHQQLQIISQQLDIITGNRAPTVHPKAQHNMQEVVKGQSTQKTTVPQAPTVLMEKESTKTEEVEKKPFGPGARISTSKETLTTEQTEALQSLIKRYTEKTQRSKEHTANNRQKLADPRAVSGFRPLFKEMIYPIVVKRSSGTTLVDLDDNEYIDMLNGYGSNFLGFNNPQVIEAVSEQMKAGIEIGPQHPLAADVAELMQDLTGLDRFAFCNTGSEAVLGATRLARTVTGRKTIVMFSGAYHGIFDEVIVRGTPSLKSFPAASGIMPEAVGNTLILEYGSDEALQIIKERGSELAAIVVEPVQSRNPALQPKNFLHKVRKLTEESGTALIFDEVITGFRIDPGGAQAYFGVKADLATYGKVIGGGLPIGIIGGITKFMDAFDGGHWQYGDDSTPTVGVTYFAGTFVRHPMALAATKAVLTHLKKEGKGLQKAINQKSDAFSKTLNDLFHTSNAPMKINNFGSLMKIDFTDDNPTNELFYFYMREKGVHIWDGRPTFLTAAHTDADLDFVIHAFRESIANMQEAGFFPIQAGRDSRDKNENMPPVPNARMGKKPDGSLAWFIPDPKRAGKYILFED
ncbi:MAG: acyl transferase domain-containing protein [Desulforhopalus sp.]|jgi:acyl transferase domain-containing protein